MKNIFTLIVVATLSCFCVFAQKTNMAVDAIRCIKMNDGQVLVIPEKHILGEEVENGVFTLTLEGGCSFAYSLANVASVSDDYEVGENTLLSFGFTHDDNDQVYADVEATITEVGDTVFVTANVPVIGKRLRPSFTLADGATLWFDGVQQISGQTSMRYSEPVVYTLAQSKHWIYNVEYEDNETTAAIGGFKPFGRPCKVSVNYLTDKATGEYKIPTVYITFGDGVTWDNTQWIGQTLTDEKGNTYNTKEEWIKDCTFRLDGAGVWPDIELVEGCEVRGRGNTSWSWNYMSKNPYRIKFPKKQKQAPFNLTKDRQWVFIANKTDASMTTNAIAQKIAAMVDGEALCHMIPIDLYINGHYRGSYCFTEKIGIADNSVAIDETMGCLIEIDSYFDENHKFRDSTYNLPVNVKDPDFSEEDDERVVTFEGIQASVNSMTATLASGGDITQHIDMESWAKFWLVNDVARNAELNHPKSCYLFNENVEGGSLWKFGPAWDFDWAFGYYSGGTYFKNQSESNIHSSTSSLPGYAFFKTLRNTEAGKRAYYKEWLDFVAEGRLEELMEYVADYTEFVQLSIAHNNDAEITEKNTTDYLAMVEQSQSWLTKRANYILKNLEKYDDIASDFVIPEDFAAPLQALVINDALHEDFAPEYPEYASVTYVRSIAAGKFGTIMLPFAPDAQSLENYAFYALSESGEGYVRFEEVAEPAANTPYLYTLREGGENSAITGGYTAVSLDVDPVAVDGWESVGSFTNHTVDASRGNYYAFSSARGEVNRVTQNLTVLPYRAYFKNTSASKSVFTVYVGGTTCMLKISGDDVEGFGSDYIYDVYGRRVMNPVKGEIYIVNGEKVMY